MRPQFHRPLSFAQIVRSKDKVSTENFLHFDSLFPFPDQVNHSVNFEEVALNRSILLVTSGACIRHLCT